MKNKFTTNIRRIIASGGRGFSRNKTVSFASIFILVITLVIIIFLFFCKGMFDYSINRLESKVNIIVYFKPDISEDNIFKVREKITNYNGVSDIVYNSEDDRLEKFKSDNRDDSNIQNTLDIIGVNPLGASLVIKSQDTLAYTDIYKQINKDFDLGGNGDIDKVNYLDIKDAIDNINNTVSWLSDIGIVIVLVFIIMSVMINYNTIRIATYVFKNEISVMKLVGASNFYIRGPFVVQGIISAIIATTISMLIAYPISYWLTNNSSNFLDGFNALTYYESNFFSLFFILLLLSISMSGISAYMAARRYLNV